MNRVLKIAALVSMTVSFAWGQATQPVTGTVKDHSGAVVPGAKVVIARIEAAAVADNSGSFRLPNVAPGEYMLLVESEGFLPWSKTGIVVEEGKADRIAADLEVAPVKERILSQTELEPGRKERYSEVLRLMKEPGLCEVHSVSGAETYRFLWLRTFDNPVLVRVEKKGPNEAARVTLKVSSGQGGYETGKLKTTKTRKLSHQEAEWLDLIIAEAAFWQLPTQIHSGVIVMDGASWTMEGTRSGKCHVVDRGTGETDAVRRLALDFLIGLAKMKLLYQEVY